MPSQLRSYDKYIRAKIENSVALSCFHQLINTPSDESLGKEIQKEVVEQFKVALEEDREIDYKTCKGCSRYSPFLPPKMINFSDISYLSWLVENDLHGGK